MGAVESTPAPKYTRRATVPVQRIADKPEMTLDEKFDSFKLTEDRETQSMLVDRSSKSEGESQDMLET